METGIRVLLLTAALALLPGCATVRHWFHGRHAADNADTQTAVPHDHYPSSTTDVIKVLCEADLNIDYADRATHRAEVAQKAADWWLPVIVFLEPAAAHLAGALMAEAILSLLGRRRADHSLLHVKVGKIEKSGTRIEWFEAHGNGHDVLEALKTFGDRHDG